MKNDTIDENEYFFLGVLVAQTEKAFIASSTPSEEGDDNKDK